MAASKAEKLARLSELLSVCLEVKPASGWSRSELKDYILFSRNATFIVDPNHNIYVGNGFHEDMARALNIDTWTTLNGYIRLSESLKIFFRHDWNGWMINFIFGAKGDPLNLVTSGLCTEDYRETVEHAIGQKITEFFFDEKNRH